jgi:hypothetical protein
MPTDYSTKTTYFFIEGRQYKLWPENIGINFLSIWSILKWDNTINETGTKSLGNYRRYTNLKCSK